MQNIPLSLTFLGAAGTVSGSKTLVSVDRKKFLVDCGLFQGPKKLRLLNWEEFHGAKEIDAVFLTHAHIDHTGYLPKLCKSGFRGPIFCSQATADLSKIMLLDAAYLQEEDARFANKSGHSKHSPAYPLFTREDAELALQQITPMPDNQWVTVAENVSVQLLRSGHLLGSRFVQFDVGRDRNFICTFSGDLGHDASHIIKGPVTIPHTDALVLESTYGDRIAPRVDPFDAVQEIVNKTYNRGGALVIPAFAVGRTQEILFIIGELKRHHRIPDVPVYIDSPMAVEATTVYKKHTTDLRPLVDGNGFTDPFHFTAYHPVQSVDDSMLLCMQDGPFIVISASGMLTGGRVLHHLKHRLGDAKNTVLFVGYQAAETKGRLLQDGIDKLRIHHVEVPVEAQICTIESLSAHANTTETIRWLRGFIQPIKHVFLNHGEPPALEGLQKRIATDLGWDTKIPKLGETFALTDAPQRALDAVKTAPLPTTDFPESLHLVRSKLYGHVLDQAAFEAIIKDVVEGKYSDVHLASFVAACTGFRLNAEEVLGLSRAMIAAGSRLKWSQAVVMDKHCVGGLPGNRTSLLVVPMIAAFGLAMPKTSSRAITSPAGTADTMEVFCPVAISLEQMRKVVEQEGACIVWGGTAKLSPADDIFIKIERALDLDSIGLMISSVLSKKAAAGSTHVLIDMPIGPTAKIRSEVEAQKIGDLFKTIGPQIGLKVAIHFSDGTQPVGKGIGPALEARDILAILRNDPQGPTDLRTRAIEITGSLLEFSGKVAIGQGQNEAEKILTSGAAFAKFKRICEAQGGYKEPTVARLQTPILASKNGTVRTIDNRQIAMVAKLAGAPEDKAAGVDFLSPLGRNVKIGDALYVIHAESPERMKAALDYVHQHHTIIRLEDQNG